MKKGIYLDYASATPLDSRVKEAMEPFFAGQFYNPSAEYGPARTVASALQDARSRIARILGAKPVEVIFTAGATEANNIAIYGVMQQFPRANMVISAIEHESVRAPAAQYKHKLVPVSAQGLVNRPIADFIDKDTVLVSIMYANNEVGSIQPIRKIAAELSQLRKARQETANPLPLYFHVDAAQAGNYLDLHVHRLGADLLTINGGKLYGPKQSGALFVRSGVVLKPLILGGGQERGLRSGTENVASAVGLAKALEVAVDIRQAESQRLQLLRNQLELGILHIAPDGRINGLGKHRLPNNLHISLPGIDNERLLMALDEKGICASAGSACSASSEEPSSVLRAMGLDDTYIRSSVRFSLGRQTSEADIVATLKALQILIA